MANGAPPKATGVVVVEVVDTADQAVDAANRTMYGLTSSILADDTYSFDCYPSGTVILSQLGVLSNLGAALSPA